MPSGNDLFGLFLMFVRTLTVLATAPVFSSRVIPTIAKIGLAAILSMLMMSVSGPAAPLVLPGSDQSLSIWPSHWLAVILMVGQEIMIGVIIGFVSNLVFFAVGMAASLMGLAVGFNAANLFDPMTTTPTTALEQMYSLLSIALFLAINGHHWFLLGLSRTFEVAPLGAFVFQSITVERLVFLTGETFATALRLALPVMGALLLVDLGLGIVARAVPQIQVFFLGLPVKEGFGYAALMLVFVLTIPLIKRLLGGVVANVLAVVR